MRIHLIACRVLQRELSYFISQSPQMIDVDWLHQGLHDTPDLLRKMVQSRMDQIHEDMQRRLLKHKPDVIALGYGLCSNGVVGLTTSDIPLVIPRTDDCIALFLGSQKRYLELFETMNGSYWLNNGWIESSYDSTLSQQEQRQRKWQQYAEEYGEENADFLLEQEELWIKNYNTCGYIFSNVYINPRYEDVAKEMAANNHWGFKSFQGDERMLRLLARGEWNDEEFLCCPPYHRVEAEYTGRKIQAVPLETK